MIKFFKNYFPEYKLYKWELIISLIAMVLIAASTASIAYMVKPVLDEIFVNKDRHFLYLLPFLVIAVFAIKGAGSYFQAYYMSYVGQDIVRKTRDKMLAHILELDIAYFHKNHSGDLLSRVINDTGRIQNAVSSSLATLVREFLTAIALISVVIYQNALLAFFTLVVIPASYYPVMILSKKLKKISHASQEKNSLFTASLNEIFSNIEAIKAYNTQNYESARFSEHNKNFFDINMKSVKTSEMVVPVMELFAAFSAAAVIIIGGNQVINGEMSVGAFFSFSTALFMAVDPVRRLSVTYSKFQDAIAADERITELLAILPEVRTGAKTIEEITSIEFKNAFLNYGDIEALRGVDLYAKRGETIALVGSSGGGKSSIVNLMLRFYDLSGGTLKFNGEDAEHFSSHSIRNKISIVSQRIYIFNDSVAANVAYGEVIDEAKVILALKRANIYEHVASMSEGIYTILNESGSNLSGGQRQRIAIARALYRNPDVLIFDEATSALDNQSEEAIINTLQAVSKEIMVIIVAHRLKTVEMANRLYIFKEGRIVCEGTKSQLLDECDYFKELYKGA